MSTSPVVWLFGPEKRQLGVHEHHGTFGLLGAPITTDPVTTQTTLGRSSVRETHATPAPAPPVLAQ
jgi:hypothetical protein